MRVKLKPLKEQTIVITGASSGIGLTTAAIAASRGANVMLVARDEDALRTIRDELRAAGGNVEYAAADVADADEMQRVVAAAIDTFGGIDTWVNNAGVGVYSDLLEISREDHERMFQTNYWGVVNGTQVAARYLMRHGGGAIINIGSVLSDVATTPLGAYAASKHAVKGFTDAFRLEMIQRKAPVSVTLIKPSGINSPWTDHAKNYKPDRARVPPMVYAPETVARAVLFAAQHPRRDILVGSSGAAIVGFSRWLPRTADRVFARALPWLHFDHSRPSVPTDDLYSPADDGRRYSDHRMVRKHSAYAAIQRHPLLTLGIALLAGAAIYAVVHERRLRARSITARASALGAVPLATLLAGYNAVRAKMAAPRSRTAELRHAVASGWHERKRAWRRGSRRAMESVGLH